jgi:hypothetical protein
MPERASINRQVTGQFKKQCFRNIIEHRILTLLSVTAAQMMTTPTFYGVCIATGLVSLPRFS